MRSAAKLGCEAGPDAGPDLAYLDGLGFQELRAEFRKAFGSDARLSPELMRLALGYQKQVERFGGLTSETRKALEQHVRSLEARGKPSGVARPRKPLKAGTRFIREWQGRVYEVQAMDNGKFAYGGRIYGSLSLIAKDITGTQWSGPRFFGLKHKGQEKAHG